jgi:hypothetical protein
MSYGDNPAGEQEYDTGPTFGAPPSYADQSGYGQPGSTPPTYRALGIIAVICGVLFNLILGLPTALISRRYSKKVTELWALGDVQAAISASRKARAWLIASIVLDAIGLILSVVLILQAPSSQLSNSSSQYYEPGVTVTSAVCTPGGQGRGASLRWTMGW